MKRIILAFLFLAFALEAVNAQVSNGRVTTSAPSYTNNTTAPLSLDTSGNMRVNCVTGCGGGGGGGDVNITQVGGNPVTTTVPVSGPLTDTQLRATAVPVSGPLTDTQLRATAVPVSGPLTDTQLRASSFPVTVTQGAVNITQAQNSAAISVNTAATTQLVALASGQVIHVTSFDFIAGGSTNVTLVRGTGTNCGTGQVALTGAYPLTAQAGIAKGNGLGPVLFVPSGEALCIINSAAQQVSGSISYRQF